MSASLYDQQSLSDRNKGLALAVSSSIFIGSSFIVKKKGLRAKLPILQHMHLLQQYLSHRWALSVSLSGTLAQVNPPSQLATLEP